MEGDRQAKQENSNMILPTINVVTRYKMELERAKVSIRKKNWVKSGLEKWKCGEPRLVRKAEVHRQNK